LDHGILKPFSPLLKTFLRTFIQPMLALEIKCAETDPESEVKLKMTYR
jgi:hypothetical protein